VALCNGPHINKPDLPEDRGEAAWSALQKAVALKDTLTPVERDLITALEARYSSNFKAEREPLDLAYAQAMAKVWANYPNDDDVGTLYAEATMDLHPWDLWTHASLRL